mmetsp:Transcript_33971/g.67645  ORF Transcript_33971/g.67645 Transcript_33971/m.67645 type:complete len:190 (-) Transcript_33971:716-1285(-)
MNQCGMQMGGLKDNNSDPNRVLRVPVGKFTEWFFSIGPQRGMCRSVQAFRNNACAMANLEQLASCGEGAQSTPGATARREIPPREPDFEIRVEWARDDGPWKSATINVAVSREDTLDEVFVRYQHALAAKLGPRDEGLLYMPQDQPKYVCSSTALELESRMTPFHRPSVHSSLSTAAPPLNSSPLEPLG